MDNTKSPAQKALVDRIQYELDGKKIDVKFYLMEMLYKSNPIENRVIQWMPYEQALQHLTHPENKYILQKSEQKRLELEKKNLHYMTKKS